MLQVAWSDGHLSEQERALILEVARSRDVVEGNPAYPNPRGAGAG